MPPIIIALIIAVTALAGGAVAQQALPAETRAEIAAVAQHVIHGFGPNIADARQSSHDNSSGDAADEIALTGTLTLTHTNPLTETEPVDDSDDEGTITVTKRITVTPPVTVTLPITPGFPISRTIGRPGEGLHGPHRLLTGSIGISLTTTISEVLSLGPSIGHGNNWEGLLAKLIAARESIRRGNAEAAHHQLDAFLNELNAFRRSGQIDETSYQTLYQQYQALVSALGETPKPTATPRASHGQGPDDTGTASQHGARSDDRAGDEREQERGHDDRHTPTPSPTTSAGVPATSTPVPPGPGHPSPEADDDHQGPSSHASVKDDHRPAASTDTERNQTGHNGRGAGKP